MDTSESHRDSSSASPQAANNLCGNSLTFPGKAGHSPWAALLLEPASSDYHLHSYLKYLSKKRHSLTLCLKSKWLLFLWMSLWVSTTHPIHCPPPHWWAVHWWAIKQLQHSCTLFAPYLFFWLSERRYCAKQDYLIGELSGLWQVEQL